MTEIKICGITSLEDARLAVELGADVLGFNFSELSPRYIAPGTASDIIRKLPDRVRTVGVLVNQSLTEVERFLTQTSIGRVQLHGDETPEFVESITSWSGPVVIKAIRIADGFDERTVRDYNVEHFLLDSASTKEYGGTGVTFDWKIALEFKKRIHQDFFLAGGLTPDNVAEAIRTVRPYGVDVCSGVEAERGKKDRRKMEAFIRNARNAL